MSSDSDDNRVAANNWAEVLRHATDDGFNADTMMCFLHEDKTVLTFHADNGEPVGILCSKSFKFLPRNIQPACQGLHGLPCSEHE